MENEETKNMEKVIETLCEQIEKQLKEISEQEVQPNNIEYLDKLIDIKKDILKIEKMKEESDMYGNYSEYGEGSYGRRGVRGSGRGSYNEGNYGRRGGGRRYRGEDMLDEAYEAYRAYNEGASYGNYGTPESMQKIEIMADSLMDFVEHIRKTAKTPEERELIDRKIQEMSRM